MTVTVAYLINQYPKVSHSFIRREILGLENHGVTVKRFALRDCQSELVDPLDLAELEKTHILLKENKFSFALACLKTILARPKAFLAALKLTLKVGWKSERGLLRNLVYLAEACVLLQRLLPTEVQHVHAHFGTNSTTVAMLCAALGGPAYSFTVHGPEEFDKVEAIALPEKIRRAKFVVAISSFGKSQLYRWSSQEDWAKIHVIRCGVDQQFLSSAHLPIPESPQLICVGRLSEQKGHLLLLAAARLLAQEGQVFKLLLVGDGELRSQVETLIDAYGLRSHIEITGWASSETIKKYLLSSRAFVLPSFAEGLPVVIMEALALGRPVISTYIAGIPELVESGVCGWLVPSGDVQALADAMRKALSATAADLETMGKIGRKRVAKGHNSMTETEKLSRLFAINSVELKGNSDELKDKFESNRVDITPVSPNP
jgi:colanic acid/amylovoran biosynthesis glycosyltransferase